ncbi:predicted protein [Chaetoceros tenuissimus]|uniref:Uncharacterized protein n=1 Tax=Chaetoceros tenuissimus TaxID=426638 RepID=A0AAD3CUP7_9STRA|nr:predicted protein [Chaetoceros tenuissimus]
MFSNKPENTQFRRMSAEDEEMFVKPGSSPVMTPAIVEPSDDKTKQGPVLPDLTEEKLKAINMPKPFSL